MGKGHNIGLIGAELGWGAQIPETELAPQTLKDIGLSDFLIQNGINANWSDIIKPEHSAVGFKMRNYAENLKQIISLDTKLANCVSACLKQGNFPVVIGGDHACAMGTWPGVVEELKCQGQFGLIWIDAHMDAHTPISSDSHAIHGMPVAGILGYGEAELTNIKFKGASILPQHLVQIGIRSYEPKEQAFLLEQGVRIFYMDEVKKRGFKDVFVEALEIVNKGTKGFGISIDIDGFDYLEAPGVGSPEPDGLRCKEVLPVLMGMGSHPNLKALEIAEYNPKQDTNQLTERLIKDILLSFFSEEAV